MGLCSQPAIDRRIAAGSGFGPCRAGPSRPSPTDSGDAEAQVLGHGREGRADEGRDRTAGAVVVVTREGGHDTAFQPEHERGILPVGRRALRWVGLGSPIATMAAAAATRIAGSAAMRNRWLP